MVLADLGRKITSASRALSNATVINEEASNVSYHAPNLSSQITNDTGNNNSAELWSHLIKSSPLFVAPN